MKKLLFGVLLGIVLAWAVSPPAVLAQAIARIYGTTSSGAPIALKATDAGALRVVCQ